MYAAQYIDSRPELGEFSSAKHWKSTTRNHMKKFIARIFVDGVDTKTCYSSLLERRPVSTRFGV